MRRPFFAGWLAVVKKPLVRTTLLSLGLFAAGCAGEGTGQVYGTLFLRGCPAFDPTNPGSHDVPNPLPGYSLDPDYFFGEIEHAVRRDSELDPPGIDRLLIRIQNSSHKAERTDVMALFVDDLANLQANQALAMARGELGMPVIPPPLDMTPTPPPPAPSSTVRASLQVNGSCDYPPVAPMLRGYIHFTEFGQQPGDYLAADFAMTMEDLRAQREQGTPAPSPDVAGELKGNFRFQIRTGPAAQAL